MLFASGWFIVQVPRPGYSTAALEQLDQLDDAYDAQDEQLWSALEQRLQQLQQDEPFMQWQWHRHLNNVRGVLQLVLSRNHGSPPLWDLLNWLAQSSAGSYGLLYVHDDEDEAGRHVGRGDVRNAFRVWCLRRGTISEHADPWLSPLVPTVASPDWDAA